MADSKQLTLFVTFHIKPNMIEEFKAAHRPVWEACASEPNCLFFDVFQDPEIPGRFRFVEVWNGSRQWFEEEQLTKPYYTTLWPKSKPTWEKDVQLEYFEREGEGSVYRKKYLDCGKLMK
jgi:quinol monooxygenase YgiN